MKDLSAHDCPPYKGGVAPLRGDALRALQIQLGGEWTIIDEHHLEKTFPFANFRDALAFTNQIAVLAESVHHHPDITLSWGQVKVAVWTHAINGLTETDFIFAAKADALGTS